MKTLSNLLNNQGFSPKEHSKAKKRPSFGNDSFDFLTLIETWPEIIGERLSKHTIPLKNKNGVLTILTNHSAFSQQLSFMEEVIIKKVCEKFPSLKGKIKKINFQANSQHFEQKAKNHIAVEVKKEKESKLPHPYSPEYRKLKQEADHLLEDIDDKDIKEALTSIFMQVKSEPK